MNWIKSSTWKPNVSRATCWNVVCWPHTAYIVNHSPIEFRCHSLFEGAAVCDTINTICCTDHRIGNDSGSISARTQPIDTHRHRRVPAYMPPDGFDAVVSWFATFAARQIEKSGFAWSSNVAHCLTRSVGSIWTGRAFDRRIRCEYHSNNCRTTDNRSPRTHRKSSGRPNDIASWFR